MSGPTRKMSRRRFFRLGLAGGALLAAGGVLALHRGRYELDLRTRRALRFFDAKGYRVFEAFADRMLDGCRPSARAIGVAKFVDGFAAELDGALQTDLRRLLDLLEHGTLLGDGVRKFTKLSAAEQDAYLGGWEHSRLVVKRTGFAALKSLAMMGYYRDERTHAGIGYPGPAVPRGFDVYAR